MRQKARLNRAILSRGWGEFLRQLEYKQRWRGGHVVAVPAHNTSRTCPACGHVDAANRPSQAVFSCTRCGLAGDADLIAAGNILRRALIDLAERSYTSHPQKQL